MNKRKLWKPIIYLLLTLLSALYLLPTLTPEGSLGDLYPFKKKLSFGLDLQGGLELRYTVDYKKAISDNLLRTRDTVINAIVSALARKEGKDPDTLTDPEKPRSQRGSRPSEPSSTRSLWHSSPTRTRVS